MRSLLSISEDTTAFPWSKRTPLRGLLSTVAVLLCLVIGQLAGHESAGAIAAGSAFTVGFAVFHEALASTLLSMGLLTLGIASATLAGSLGAHWTAVVLVLVLLASVNYGLLAGLGPTAGWIGQQCGVFVIIASYFAQGRHYALGRATMVLVGGAVQMMVYAGGNLLSHSGPRPPLARQLRTRSSQLWRGLLNELHWSAGGTGYIVRLAVTLVLSTVFYRWKHLGNGYWAPMTALLVLKPQWASTLSRGIARLAGTMVAAAVAIVMALYIPLHPPAIFALVIVTAWACFALQAVNYALFSFFLTLYTVFSFRFGGFSQPAAAHLRLLNTAIGGAIALAVDATWKWLGPRTTPNAGHTPNSGHAPDSVQ